MMSAEIILDPLKANQRFLNLSTRLREEKPEGEELSRLFDEIAEAQSTAFYEIPVSQMAKNITPQRIDLRARIKALFGV